MLRQTTVSKFTDDDRDSLLLLTYLKKKSSGPLVESILQQGQTVAALPLVLSSDLFPSTFGMEIHEGSLEFSKLPGKPCGRLVRPGTRHILYRIQGPAIRKPLSTFIGVERASYNARPNTFHVSNVSSDDSFAVNIPEKQNGGKVGYIHTRTQITVDWKERVGNRKQIAFVRTSFFLGEFSVGLFPAWSFKITRHHGTRVTRFDDATPKCPESKRAGPRASENWRERAREGQSKGRQTEDKRRGREDEDARNREDRYWPMCGGVMVAIGGSVPFVSPRAPIHHRASNHHSPCIYIHSVYTWTLWHRVYMVLRMATQPGRTLRLSLTEPRLGRRTCARAHAKSSANLYVPTRTGTYSVHDAVHCESVRVSFNVYLYTCVCMRVYVKRIHARSYQHRRIRPPVHQGTKPKAINLFARQPATRHCVYPHVNHYVRLRDIEPDTRPVSQRISNSPFPAVGQNA